MASDRLQTMASIDPARLTAIVRQVQASPNFEIGRWEVGLLSKDGMVNPEGLFLAFGVALGEEALRSIEH